MDDPLQENGRSPCKHTIGTFVNVHPCNANTC
jgi:hypothetical protein